MELTKFARMNPLGSTRQVTSLFLSLFASSSLVLLTGCPGGGGSDFAGLDNTNKGADNVPCKIDSETPVANSLKVAAASGTKTLFTISPSTSSCKVFYFVNGVRVNSTSSNFIELDSTTLTAGVNTIRVEANNSLGSDNFEWQVTKNTPPTCSRTSPTASAVNMAATASQAFTVGGTPEAGETLSFRWLLEGSTNAALVETISGSTASQAMFTASSALVGVKTISAEVSDGYDVTTCSWSANIGQECQLTAKSPNVSSIRMASAAGSSNGFSVTASTSSCLVSWTLNGADMTGNGTSRTVQSTELGVGSNVLKAEVSSSSGTTSQIWTVVKNSPPTCAQSPSATGNTISAGATINLNATITDANNDPVTWSWRQNGSSTSSPPVSISNGSGTSNAAFTPTSSHIGFNSFELRMDDGYDTAICNWSVQVYPQCSIGSVSPAGTTTTIPNLGTNSNAFSVVPSDGSCNISWSLNGINLGTNAAFVNLLSSSFATSSNLAVTVSNASSSQTHTWNVTKNTPPVCASFTPVNTGTNLAVSTTTAFTATLTDANAGQSHSYDWRLDGATPSATYFTSSNGALSSTGTWTALNAQVGSHNLTLNVNDGYDSVACTWPVDVLRNCAVSSATPSASSLRVSFAPTTVTSFGVVPNDPSCSIVWKLNGSTVASDVNFRDFTSSTLTSGTPDTVTATLTNAVGSTTRSWTVAKNSRPVCSSQSPSASGNTINVGGSQIFTGNATDAESDALAFSWTFNGANAGLFSGVTNATFSSSATLNAGLGQVGNNQTVALTMNDGYDSTTCTWGVDVVDPNSAQIISWTPTQDPAVILSTGSQTFTVSATGTGLSYAWYLDTVLQSSKTTSAETFANTDMTIGNHVIKVVVTDTYGNTAEKSFNVKRNAAPSKTSFIPNIAGVTTYKLNYSSTMNFSIAATDANGDTLAYTWTLDNASNSAIVAGGNAYEASLQPNGSTLLLGPHTVKVSISDGYETTTQSWNVMINMFSNECNDLYNSSPTGTGGGRVCTLVGNPSMGHGQDIYTDPTLLKARPYQIIEIETNVFVFTDHINHSVILYNANPNGADKSYFGQTVPPRTAKVVLGNGAAGRNSDASSPVSAYQTVGTPPTQVSMPSFKLNEPRGIAYDSTRSILYVADRYNRRVLAINSSGMVSRVLGLTAAGNTQNATTNSVTETFGYDQVCVEPMGLAIAGRYLYVSCWSQHVIKRVNIDNPATTATYGLTLTVVGRQNASAANSVSPTASVSPDGAGGSSNVPATGAVAYANNVINLATDGAGLIYWIERAGSNQGLRLRAYNPTASPVTFYTNAPNSDHVSLSGAFNFQAFDLTGASLTSSNFQANIVNATGGTLGAVGVTSNANLGVNVCHMVNTRLLDAGSNPITLASPQVVTMAVTAGTGAFYSDSGCTSALPSSQFTIPAGVSQGSVFVKMTAASGYTLRATAGAFNSTSSGTAVATTTTATTVRLTAPPRFKPNECALVELSLANGTTPAILAAGRVISPTTNNYGSFYSDASCTTSIDRVTFSSSQATQFAYFRRTVTIPSGWTGTLAGYNNSGAASYGEYTNNVRIGQMRFEDGQTGLDILRNGSTGLPDGFAYSNQSQHYVAFINLLGVDPGLGVGVSSQSANIIFGQLNNVSTPTDITGGYNGEDQAALGTRLNQPTSANFNLAGNRILIADYVNNRGRTYEMDAQGFARTSIGAGRQRDRVGVTTLDSTAVALVNPYKLEFFNNYIYFSEYGNHRIRRTNLASGVTEVIAGNGTTGTPTEGNDATFDNMNNPRGFKVIAYPSSASPTNFVLFYAETCQVRAVNLSGPTISNFFGVGNLLPGKVKTIAGDTANGCATWSTLPNSDGMTALTARLNVPEDLAYMDGELYIISASDHCLLRLSTDGKLYRPQGPSSCSTSAPTTNDATMDVMRTRTPKSFSPDVANPGNYFLIDQYGDTTGFIRYINNSLSQVSFKNSAPIPVAGRANGSAPPLVKTVYQYSATSGASGVGGVATWVQTTGSSGSNDKVCWTAGVVNDGSNGAHAIYCANRFQDDDGALAAGPSNGSGIRGGAPLDREQEKISRLNATFYAPYGIAFDDDGNLYISEYNNHIIRMIRRWW